MTDEEKDQRIAELELDLSTMRSVVFRAIDILVDAHCSNLETAKCEVRMMSGITNTLDWALKRRLQLSIEKALFVLKGVKP